MDQAARTRLERNIFPAAHPACEPWGKFPWHTGRDGTIDTHLPYSSQALAIDVFGTIKTSPECDIILDVLAKTLELPTGGPWTITLEWAARASLLNEPRPTQIDVYAESPQAVMFMECKFTEQDGGACSQTVNQDGIIPCNGNYMQQINPRNGVTNRCALSTKGIQYWDMIPKVFLLDPQTDYHPCPFAGPAYQWMRNLVVAYKVARQRNKQPAVMIIYADSPGLPMAKKFRSRAWTDFTKTIRQEHVPLHVRSYQDILMLAQETARHKKRDLDLWRELTEWVNRKIAAAGANRKGGRKPKKRNQMPSNAKPGISATRNG